MPNEDLKRKLADTLESFRRQGLYTHAFAATGYLDEPVDTQKAVSLGETEGFFDLSSLSKAFCTTSLVFASLKKENLGTDATLAEWMSSSRENPVHRELSVWGAIPLSRILAHTAGLPAWRNFYVCRLTESISRDELLQEPGRSGHILEVLNRVRLQPLNSAHDLYSDLGFICLGLLLECKYQTRLDLLFANFLANDLGLASSSVAYATQLNALSKADFVSTGQCAIRKRVLQGEVHDENCAALGGVSGHSGLFANGPAVVAFLKALYGSGIGKTIIAENAMCLKPGNPSLMGWRQGNDEASSVFGDGLSMGHWGFTGTGFWICPQTRRYAVFLTNRVISARISPDIKRCRREVFSLLNDISR